MRKLFTISELAKEHGLTQRILCYWLTKWEIKETARVGVVRIYDAKKSREIRKMIEAARKVSAFYKPRARQQPLEPRSLS